MEIRKLFVCCMCGSAGVIYHNGFAGRSHEWSVMELDTVKAAASSGNEWLCCDEHKTDDVYGELVKHIAPSTWAAIRQYISLPRRDSKLFLLPTAKARL